MGKIVQLGENVKEKQPMVDNVEEGHGSEPLDRIDP